MAQMGVSTPLPPSERQKAESERMASGKLADYPQLVDIAASTGINFEHLSSPEAKFIAESMSGGVALIDYDRDGWPDIYFTNAQSVDMALHGKKSRSALYHNNHDGTFTDVTDKAGVGFPCWAKWSATEAIFRRTTCAFTSGWEAMSGLIRQKFCGRTG